MRNILVIHKCVLFEYDLHEKIRKKKKIKVKNYAVCENVDDISLTPDSNDIVILYSVATEKAPTM